MDNIVLSGIIISLLFSILSILKKQSKIQNYILGVYFLFYALSLFYIHLVSTGAGINFAWTGHIIPGSIILIFIFLYIYFKLLLYHKHTQKRILFFVVKFLFTD